MVTNFRALWHVKFCRRCTEPVKRMLRYSILSVVAPIVATALYFLFIYVRHLWILRKFTGPFPLPLIGNCYDPDVVKSVLKYFAKARKNYGSVFAFFSFSQASLVVLDPVVVRRILSDGRAFPISTECTNIFRYILGNGLVTSLGEKHRKDRDLFARYFTRGSIAKRSFAFNVIADQAIDQMVRTAKNTRKPTNISMFFEVCTLRMFMKFFSGTEYRQFPESERLLCEMLSEGAHALSHLILFGLPTWSFLPQVKVLDRVIKEIRQDFDTSLSRRRAEHAEGQNLDTEDCLNAMLAEHLPEADMFDHFITLLSAGHDTTAYFTSYLVYLLAHHPDVQDQLRAEIKGHFLGRTEVAPDDIAELPYLAKVMQETLRYYAIMPLLTRTAAEEVHIKEANITIPKGVEIVIPIAIINRDPSIWVNPSVFDPERFEGRSTSDCTSARSGYFPFGYGSRACIGNALAQIECGIFVCKLLQRCRVAPDPAFKIHIMSGISLTTKGGIWVQCKPL